MAARWNEQSALICQPTQRFGAPRPPPAPLTLWNSPPWHRASQRQGRRAARPQGSGAGAGQGQPSSAPSPGAAPPCRGPGCTAGSPRRRLCARAGRGRTAATALLPCMMCSFLQRLGLGSGIKGAPQCTAQSVLPVALAVRPSAPPTDTGLAAQERPGRTDGSCQRWPGHQGWGGPSDLRYGCLLGNAYNQNWREYARQGPPLSTRDCRNPSRWHSPITPTCKAAEHQK